MPTGLSHAIDELGKQVDEMKRILGIDDAPVERNRSDARSVILRAAEMLDEGPDDERKRVAAALRGLV